MTPLLISPPPVEPVSLEEAKGWLRIDSNDEDLSIQTLIVASRVALEAYTRRFFITQTWRVTFDIWPETLKDEGVLRLGFAPFQRVIEVRRWDASGSFSVVAPSTYAAPAATESIRISFNQTPAPPDRARDGIEIDIALGYGGKATDVPPGLRQALLILVAHHFENRGDSPSFSMMSSPQALALSKPFRRERLR